MKSSITYNAELEIELHGTYVAGSKSQYDRFHGNWLPGDADDVEGFRVTLNGKDITSLLTADQRAHYESEFMTAHEEGREGA